MTNQSLDDDTHNPPLNPWKWWGIGCGGCLLLSLVALLGLGFLGSQFLKMANLKFDPAESEAKAQEIFAYQFPETVQGGMAGSLFGAEFAMVADQAEEPTTSLLVAKAPQSLIEGSDAGDFQQQLEESFKEQTGSDAQSVKSRTETRTLCGQETPVMIESGMMEPTEPANPTNAVPRTIYIASVPYENYQYFAFLLTSGADAEAKAEKLFNSLQCR